MGTSVPAKSSKKLLGSLGNAFFPYATSSEVTTGNGIVMSSAFRAPFRTSTEGQRHQHQVGRLADRHAPEPRRLVLHHRDPESVLRLTGDHRELPARLDERVDDPVRAPLSPDAVDLREG